LPTFFKFSNIVFNEHNKSEHSGKLSTEAADLEIIFSTIKTELSANTCISGMLSSLRRIYMVDA
jgi:hypothetical protein